MHMIYPKGSYMKLSIFGAGYVGLVTAACFAEMGNHVCCVDIDPARLAMLRRGESPIYEPGLSDMLRHNIDAERIEFTDDARCAVEFGEVIFIAVGTPPKADGSADLQYVESVAKSIGQSMNAYKVIVNKSTVPVGTAKKVAAIIAQALSNKHLEFDVVSNPEFLKEGAAIEDFMQADRVIIGSESERALAVMHNLYVPVNRNQEKLIAMDLESAEMTKYAANAMLATKISFMNEMSQIAERVGADIEKVRIGIGSDSRIGFSFINPGCGYGGSCFPKDVSALEHTAAQANYDAQLLRSVEAVNAQQKQVLFEKIQQHFAGNLRGRVIAVWGLAFKPNTDDLREASSRVLIEALWQAGGKVQAYDPEAMPAFIDLYGERADLQLVSHPEQALDNADALVVVTEWMEFRSPDFQLIKQKLKEAVIFDGRNLYDLNYLKKLGFEYYGIGRGGC